MGSDMSPPGYGLWSETTEKMSALDGVHTAAGPLAANIPQLPQDLLCWDHKAELLVRGTLFSTEVTRCGFFAAVATI